MFEQNMCQPGNGSGARVMRNGSRAVKRLLFLGLGSALMVTMGGVGSAQADNGPHISSAQVAGASVVIAQAGAGRCASCHRAHTAAAEYLLVEAQPALCYTCHDGTGATTDVKDGVSQNGLALRGGGFNTAALDADNATKKLGLADPATGRIATTDQTIPTLGKLATTTSKHLIDGVTGGTAWGNGANGAAAKSLTLECGSCHDPHGNGNYRILKPMPVDSGYASHEIKAAVAFKAGTPAVVADPTAVPPVLAKAAVPDVLAAAAVMSPVTGITIPDARAKVYTTTNYWLAGDTNVPVDPTATLTGVTKTTDVQPDGYINNVANWCTTCHTKYQAASGSYKTSSGDANGMYKHRSDANYKAGAPNCITCHVSHGSNATMIGTADAVANPGGGGSAKGDSKLLRVSNRGTCVMCHNV
jgi:predicted CXXCH cytochrome family protein